MGNANYSGSYFQNASTSTAYSGFNNQHVGGFGTFATSSYGVYSFGTGDVDAERNLVIIIETSHGTILVNTLTGTTLLALLQSRVRQQHDHKLAAGLLKTWLNYDADASTPAVEDSFNVASLSDIGLGRIDINYTSNMGNATFSVQAT